VKLLFRTPLTNFTGYGTEGIELARQFSNIIDLALWPTQASMGLPGEVLKILGQEVPKEFDIFLDFTDPFSAFGRMGRKFSVLFTMWEQTKMTTDFSGNKIGEYDLVLVPNEVNAKTYSEYIDRSKIRIVPLGVDTKFYDHQRRPIRDKVRFCSVGHMSRRKGIDLIVDAFTQVRKEYDCSLSIRTTGAGLHPQWAKSIPDFYIHLGPWGKLDLRKFYHENDVMLALTRGEGFNLPAIEFMSTGGTVIACGWGGHKQWVNEEYMYEIPYEMQKVRTGYKYLDPESEWAEPSLEHAVKAMIKCCEDKAELNQKLLNTKIVRQQFNIQKVAAEILEVIYNEYQRG
jgi:glycosyltransferase involved in cell wall biosynthesis